MMDKI